MRSLWLGWRWRGEDDSSFEQKFAYLLKLVYWDRTGLCLFSERLEQVFARGSIRTIGVEPHLCERGPLTGG